MAGGRRQPTDALRVAAAEGESLNCKGTTLKDSFYSRSVDSMPAEPVQQYPDAITWLSQRVKPDGWPEQVSAPAKEQPWRKVWSGPTVSKDGKLIIACPKGYEWGSGSGLGGY